MGYSLRSWDVQVLHRTIRYLDAVPGRRWVFLAMAFTAAGMAVAGVVIPATGFTLYHTGGPSLEITYSYWSDVVGVHPSGNWPVAGGRYVVVPALLSGFLFLLNLRSDDGLLRGLFAANGFFILLAFFLVDLSKPPPDSGISPLSAGPGQVVVAVAGALSLATALSNIGYSEWRRPA